MDTRLNLEWRDANIQTHGPCKMEVDGGGAGACKLRAWRETARVKGEIEMETEQNRETGASCGLSS